MSSLDHHIRRLAPEALQVNLWPTERGFQANVKERAGRGWTVVTGEDPIAALTEALRQRAAGLGIREVVSPEDAAPPAQIDIEEAIAAAAVTPVPAGDDFDGMLG